jgi:hypothetical protein
MTQSTSETPTTRHSRVGRVFSILAFVFAGLSVLAAPILFGLFAIVLAALGVAGGDRRGGLWAAGAAVVATTIGWLLIHNEVFPRLFPGTFG